MTAKAPVVNTGGPIGQALDHLLCSADPTIRRKEAKELMRFIEADARRREREAFRDGANWAHVAASPGYYQRDWLNQMEAEATYRYPEVIEP